MRLILSNIFTVGRSAPGDGFTMIAPIQSNLSGLPVGDTGVIADIDGDSPIVRRLLEMGLTSGTPVRVVREAPFGDPIQVQVRGYHLTLRRAEADHVRIAAL